MSSICQGNVAAAASHLAQGETLDGAESGETIADAPDEIGLGARHDEVPQRSRE